MNYVCAGIDGWITHVCEKLLTRQVASVRMTMVSFFCYSHNSCFLWCFTVYIVVSALVSTSMCAIL